MTKADIKYLSHKIKKKKNRRFDGEKHIVVVSEPKKVKTKDAFEGKNLSKAPEDEIFDALSSHFQEWSSVLIELTQPINLGIEEHPHMIHLAQSLSPKEKEEFIAFFQEKKINFAQTYSNMPRLDPDLIMHHLFIAPGIKLVKQKLHKIHPHVALLVKAKLEKLLEAGFICAIDFSKWISNIFPISKHDKSIRVCTNFQDLKLACPKDDFPLSNIDMIVDMMVGYKMYSLMDGFFGYNQIKIALEDQE